MSNRTRGHVNSKSWKIISLPVWGLQFRWNEVHRILSLYVIKVRSPVTRQIWGPRQVVWPIPSCNDLLLPRRQIRSSLRYLLGPSAVRLMHLIEAVSRKRCRSVGAWSSNSRHGSAAEGRSVRSPRITRSTGTSLFRETNRPFQSKTINKQ